MAGVVPKYKMYDPDFARYMRAISRFKRPSTAEERELALKIKAGDTEARNRLMCGNLQLVVSVAKKFRGRGLDLPDLVAEGNCGLLRAAELFDPDLAKFCTYATCWIKQAIYKALYANHLAHVPVHVFTNLSKWQQRWPVDQGECWTDWLDRLPGLKAAQRQQALAALKVFGGIQDVDEIAPTAVKGGEGLKSLLAAEDVNRVFALISSLQAREQLVVIKRLGLDGAGPQTLEEVGRLIGVTKERVRQVQLRAYAKLTELLDESKLVAM